MTEDELQKAVAKYLDHHPATKGHWFHPPNGSFYGGTYRVRAMRGAKMKAMGVKAGVPDVIIVRPPDNLGIALSGSDVVAVAIELKVGRNKPTPAQVKWHDTLRACGWRVEVCYSFEEVKKVVTECYG